MFYVNFINLCARDNVTAADVGRAIGVSGAAISKWKKGGMPSDVTLAKLSNYFNVSLDDLLTDEEETSPAKSAEDETLEELLERLKTREEMKMLFKLADGATKEDVLRAVAIIEALNSN